MIYFPVRTMEFYALALKSKACILLEKSISFMLTELRASDPVHPTLIVFSIS